MSLFDSSFSNASDDRTKHLRDQAASGLSVAEYCRRHDVCAATFYHWRRQSREAVGRGRVSFTEIGRAAAVEPQWAAEIVLVSGTVVRVSSSADSHLLRCVVEALR